MMILIAIGLSMDSLAVSVVNGLTELKLTKIKLLKLAAPMAISQGLLAVIGWYLGLYIANYIHRFDHWIAFVLLAIIGGKMIYDGLSNDEPTPKQEIGFIKVFLQSIATSIDAMVVGLTLALLAYPILFPAIIIGFTTLVFSLLGLLAGKIIGRHLSHSFGIIGGIILILIGVKILVEHLFF